MDENLNLTGNTEIEKALKEFEVKSQAEQIQKAPEILKDSEIPEMVQLVMKWFGFEEQKQAEYVLLAFVVVMIGISLYLVFNTTSSNKMSSTQKAALDQMLQQHPDLIKK